jgi:hypothetical protein
MAWRDPTSGGGGSDLMGIVHPGERNPKWRGGKTIASNGYVLIRVGIDHHLADVRGYAYEHRIVAEKKIGRRLLPAEEIHHINGVKTDNSPENLEVTEDRANHFVFHRNGKRQKRIPGEPNPVVFCACGCGGSFQKFDASNRSRRCISGHNAGARHG